MKFAISSHKHYFEKTHEIILNSLIDVGIKKEDIFFFIGGHEKKNHNQLIFLSNILHKVDQICYQYEYKIFSFYYIFMT